MVASPVKVAVLDDYQNLTLQMADLSHDRTENFASRGGAVLGQASRLWRPRVARAQSLGAGGRLDRGETSDAAEPSQRADCVPLSGRDLHLVMGPATRGTSVRFRVLNDGQPPDAGQGIDVDDRGGGAVTEQRLYQLIRQPKPIADRQFEIEFLEPGLEAFAFTFG
jgi:hypothetical protein